MRLPRDWNRYEGSRFGLDICRSTTGRALVSVKLGPIRFTSIETDYEYARVVHLAFGRLVFSAGWCS